MSLCVDLVLNHTAKEHEWAVKARAGDPAYQAYYRMFDDRTLPDRYEATLTEVFPAHAPGNFTWYPGPRQMGVDDLQRAPVGPQLGEPAGLPRDRRGDAVSRQQGRRGAPPRCGGVPVEADGDALPERARGPRHPPGAPRREPHRGPGGDPQGGGDRLAARPRPLSRRGQPHAAARATSPTTIR